MSVSGENIVNVEESVQSRKLFIGGLHHTTTEDSLKNFFNKWGNVVHVVIKKHPITKSSRGFGFITYSKSSMVDDAMANKPHKIDGREVDTKHAKPYNDVILYGKMFISGIKEQAEEDLKEYFGQFGNILNFKFITDKNTGKHKGSGFIEFDNSDSVDKAVLIKNHRVSGTNLKVKKTFNKYVASAYRIRRRRHYANSRIEQILGVPNYNYWRVNHFMRYGGGSGGCGRAQDWNNFLGIQDAQEGRPMQGHFGNNRAGPYHSGRGYGNFYQKPRGWY